MAGKRTLVYGVGINNWKDNVEVCGKKIREYVLWKGVMERCFSEKHNTKHPTYVRTTCDLTWIYMTNFIDDVSKLIGYEQEGWALDKDILVKGNKIYSSETCCFVPQEINNLLINRFNFRGVCPLGVTKHKTTGKFLSEISINGKGKHLGSFNNPTDAFQAYKQAKEAYIKEVANKWKDQIDPKVYEALMKYEVEITD